MMKNKKVSLGKLSCFSRASRKKGISAIVATVLIILITVAAVTIIWAAIIPMISNQLDKGVICLDAVSQVQLRDEGYTCYNTSINSDNYYEVSLQVGRGSGEFELADIQVLVSVGGTTTPIDLVGDGVVNITDLPGPNGAEVFVVNGSNFNETTKISIAPIVKVGNTQEACDISATKTIIAC
jgi:flagellin-like protein